MGENDICFLVDDDRELVKNLLGDDPIFPELQLGMNSDEHIDHALPSIEDIPGGRKSGFLKWFCRLVINIYDLLGLTHCTPSHGMHIPRPYLSN